MTTNFDLLHYAKILKNNKQSLSEPSVLNNFCYVMSDEVKDLPMTNFSAIMNYQLSKQEGSHHVGLFRKGDGKLYYFDSYGQPVQKQVIEKYKGCIRTHDYQIQKPNTSLCGQMSLLVIYLLDNGFPFENILFELRSLHF